MQSQESMFEPPKNRPADQRSVNTDPREWQQTQEAPRQERYAGEYQEGYAGTFKESEPLQAEGEKIYPRQQPPRKKGGMGKVLVILALFLLLLAGGGVLASGGARGVGPFNATQSMPTRTFIVGAQPTLILNTENSDVRIHRGATNRVTIEATQQRWGFGSSSQPVDVSYQQNGDTIEVTTQNEQDWFIGDNSVDFEITIPETSNLQIHTGSGDIDVENVNGQLTLDTGSGEITTNNVNGPLSLKTGSGDISARNINGQITLNSGSGEIRLEDAVLTGQSHLKTGSGSIRVDGSLDAQGSYRFETGSGDVELNLPDNASFNLDAQTGSGEVNNEFGSTSVGSNPRPSVQVQTGSGDIELNRGR